MPVRKAVIPAAGRGTRFLPASKAVPKVLLPLVDRPIIQYAVEELARAGITDVCVVTALGDDAVVEHFTRSPELEAALAGPDKQDLLAQVREIYSLADIYYIRQHDPLGLGHAVWVAREHVDDEPFVVVLPDEIVEPGAPFLAEMVADFEENGRSVVAVLEVPGDDIQLYGAIETGDPPDGLMRVTSVVEKPDPATAPSNLALIGRYVLEPEVFDVLAKLQPGAGGEIQLADALGVLAGRGKLLAKRLTARRWDVGNKAGYLQAVVALAAERDDLGPAFREYLKKIVF
jgi:UTP--glucose-1-phosphate uridylyltransferase